MSEKNNQANQPLNNQGYSAQPSQIGGQSAVNQNFGFQPPPPTYDQSFPDQGQQQHQYYPAPPGTQVVTVITAPVFGPDPQLITCPSCRNVVTTRIDYESSSKTHLMAVILCLLVWPCFWLPYAIDNCKNANHLCPVCSAYLGTYQG